MKNNDKPPMKSAPFKVGDRVRTSWPIMSRDSETWWETRVVSIRRVTYSESGSGWLVVGAATDPCKSCGTIVHAETPPLGADWFEAIT